jgi:7,8-dihydropterin-6-yl-methyl-4-(beta-D-ribofuranosyl)aminobenzene 5'-phosphate synthase
MVIFKRGMVMAQIQLPEVQRAEVTILVDNYSDLLLPDTDTVKRLRLFPPNAPLAEHGLSYLISVHVNGQHHTILMDAGISGHCLMHNAALFASRLGDRSDASPPKVEDVECIVLSHGHFDHFGGLPYFLARVDRKLPLVVHPGAFIERRVKFGPEVFAQMPSLTEERLTAAGAIVDKRSAPSTVAGGYVLVAGTVARTTDFEKGSPILEAQKDGEWQIDSFEDDQAIAFRLKDQGLVVLGGCSHAGIINTIAHIRNVSGIDKVHAVLGGFHLSGAAEVLIEPTVRAMQQIDPQLVVPTHCTGWTAINAFAAAMPDRFVLNSVGTTFLFGESSS